VCLRHVPCSLFLVPCECKCPCPCPVCSGALRAPKPKHQAPSTKHQAPSTKHNAQRTKHKAQHRRCHKAQSTSSTLPGERWHPASIVRRLAGQPALARQRHSLIHRDKAIAPVNSSTSSPVGLGRRAPPTLPSSVGLTRCGPPTLLNLPKVPTFHAMPLTAIRRESRTTAAGSSLPALPRISPSSPSTKHKAQRTTHLFLFLTLKGSHGRPQRDRPYRATSSNHQSSIGNHHPPILMPSHPQR